MGNKSSRTTQESDELLEKEINVLKSTTNLNEDEIREFYSEFIRQCPSGRMDKQKFHEFYGGIVPAKDEDRNRAEQMFAVFDKNHDGSIDFGEFVLTVCIINNNDLDSKLELAFALLDTSGDKQISYDEVVNFFSKAVKLQNNKEINDANPKVIASAIYELFGVEEEKKLSKAQFIDGCKNNKTLGEIFGSD